MATLTIICQITILQIICQQSSNQIFSFFFFSNSRPNPKSLPWTVVFSCWRKIWNVRKNVWLPPRLNCQRLRRLLMRANGKWSRPAGAQSSEALCLAGGCCAPLPLPCKKLARLRAGLELRRSAFYFPRDYWFICSSLFFEFVSCEGGGSTSTNKIEAAWKQDITE